MAENEQLRSDLETAQSTMAKLQEELAGAREAQMEWVSPAATSQTEVWLCERAQHGVLVVCLWSDRRAWDGPHGWGWLGASGDVAEQAAEACRPRGAWVQGQ